MSLGSIRNVSGKQTALLMHHGMVGSAKNFRPIINNSRIFNSIDTIQIDSSNHGISSHQKSNTVTNLANDLFVSVFQQIIVKKRKWNEVILLGHSMGGITVMQLTNRYPQLQDYISKVIIVDMPDQDHSKELQMLINAQKINLDQNLSQIHNQIQKIAVNEDYANILKQNLKVLENGKYKWKTNLQKLSKQYDQMKQYTLKKTNWKKPVEVIFGKRSKYSKEDQMRDLLNSYPHMKKNNFHQINEQGNLTDLNSKEQLSKTLQGIMKKTDDIN